MRSECTSDIRSTLDKRPMFCIRAIQTYDSRGKSMQRTYTSGRYNRCDYFEYEKSGRTRNTGKTYSRAKQTPSSMLFVMAASILIILSALWLGMRLSEYAAVADSFIEQSQPVYYRSIEIHAGDTLLSIANREIGESGSIDKNSFIREVETVNGINRDSIHAGNYIIVPCFG